MNQTTGPRACHDCINRYHTAKNEIRCRKGLECSNEELCADFCTEEIFEEKVNTLRNDRKEHSHRRVLVIFIALGAIHFLITFGLLGLNIFNVLNAGILSITVGIDIYILRSLYIGKNWAVILINIILVVGIICSLVSLVTNPTASITDFSSNIVGVSINSFYISYINFGKDFKRHIKYIRNFQ